MHYDFGFILSGNSVSSRQFQTCLQQGLHTLSLEPWNADGETLLPQFVKVARHLQYCITCMDTNFWKKLHLRTWSGVCLSDAQSAEMQQDAVSQWLACIAQTDEPLSHIPDMVLAVMGLPDFDPNDFAVELSTQLQSITTVAKVAGTKHNDLSTLDFGVDEIEAHHYLNV